MTPACVHQHGAQLQVWCRCTMSAAPRRCGRCVGAHTWCSLGLSSFLAASAEVRASPASTPRPASWLLCRRLQMRSSIVRSTSPWIISSLENSALLPSSPAA